MPPARHLAARAFGVLPKDVAYLTTTRGMALNDLLRFKYQLAKAVQEKIAAYRQQAYADSYQTFPAQSASHGATSFADGFAFDNRPYPAAWAYQGAYQFRSTFSARSASWPPKGEEFECAKLIDTCRKSNSGFATCQAARKPRSGCRPRPTVSIPISWPC
jgi:hypothetical protein